MVLPTPTPGQLLIDISLKIKMGEKNENLHCGKGSHLQSTGFVFLLLSFWWCVLYFYGLIFCVLSEHLLSWMFQIGFSNLRLV